MEHQMSVYEAVGMAWIIFTSAIATLEIVFLALVGLKTLLNKSWLTTDIPAEVKEMFKISR
jgi:hypothetical protein